LCFKEECQKLNWEKKIEEMKNQFTAWGKRNLTIMGKILIIKTLILPKFTFLASSCVVPKMSKNIPYAVTGFCVHLITLILSLQFFSLPNYKNTHPAEIYLLSQFMCSTKDVYKRN
jgi:hypothetical protein